MGRKTRRRAAALALAGALLLAGCGQKTAAGTHETEMPEGFVNNSADLSKYDSSQLVWTGEDEQILLGVRDEQVYLDGKPGGVRLAQNMVSWSASSDGSNGFPLARIEDRIGTVRLGEHEYELEDLARGRYEGFDVLKQLAGDFGVLKLNADTGALENRLGKYLTDEALREAYSERADYDEYSVCVYYLDAKMSGMDDELYTQCAEKLKSDTGSAWSDALDGTLAVMLYYDTTGHDSFYVIAVSAPCWWQDFEDFEANRDSRELHDITNCFMEVDGEKTGFVNQVFFRFDQEVDE